MAGQLSGSGTGSAIDVMRSGGQSDHFSSVDNADTVIGQIVVAQALYEQMTAGKPGSYGACQRGRGRAEPGPHPLALHVGDRDREPVRRRSTPGP